MTAERLRADLAAVVAVQRALLAAGWRYDATTPMADGTVERTVTHPTGRTVTACTGPDGTTALTITGLSLAQVAAAVRAAGLTDLTGGAR